MIDQHNFYLASMSGASETEENKRLVQKFPWLWPSDWNFNPVPEEEYDYSWTVLDEFPEGWKIAFSKKMCEEIQAVLEEYDCVEMFHIDQLKEKFGAMRLYFSIHSQEDENGNPVKTAPRECYKKLNDIIHKYEAVSAYSCCICGKPATRISTGWICPYCDEHSKNLKKTLPIEKWYSGKVEKILDKEGYISDVIYEKEKIISKLGIALK